MTAEYDPEDLTTFRNFKKPDFGYAMIYCILSDECRPKDGNTAVPSFTFTLDMTKDGASCTVKVAYVFSEAEWNSAAESGTLLNLFMRDAGTAALIYLAEGDGECTACHGTGKVDGELYVDGEAEPVVLVNRLKTGIRFTAEKLMDGQPAAEPFEFMLLETDVARSTEKEIARTKNGMDGKILFENVYVDPVPAGDRYYVIREAVGTNPAVEYDTGEDLYKVTIISSPDGIHTVNQKLISGDGIFRNTRKAGSLAIEIKTKGYTRPWWAWNWEPPRFRVNVLLKDREGRPLAGYPLPGTPENGFPPRQKAACILYRMSVTGRKA